MGDPAGDVGPGGAALVRQLLGDIIKGEDVARRVGGQLHGQGSHVAMGAHLHDTGVLTRLHEIRQFGRNIRQPPADRIILLSHQNGRCRTVEQQDYALQVDRQDACTNARKDGFDEGAAFVQLTIGRHQGTGLRFEALRHPVEGRRERSDFIAAQRTGDAGRQITCGNAPRSRHQLIDRAHHPVGHRQGDIDGDPDQQQ